MNHALYLLRYWVTQIPPDQRGLRYLAVIALSAGVAWGCFGVAQVFFALGDWWGVLAFPGLLLSMLFFGCLLFLPPVILPLDLRGPTDIVAVIAGAFLLGLGLPSIWWA